MTKRKPCSFLRSLPPNVSEAVGLRTEDGANGAKRVPPIEKDDAEEAVASTREAAIGVDSDAKRNPNKEGGGLFQKIAKVFGRRRSCDNVDAGPAVDPYYHVDFDPIRVPSLPIDCDLAGLKRRAVCRAGTSDGESDDQSIVSRHGGGQGFAEVIITKPTSEVLSPQQVACCYRRRRQMLFNSKHQCSAHAPPLPYLQAIPPLLARRG